MLREKDLQIGDWVLYQGHPNRVYRILPATVPFADIGRAAEDLLHIVWNGVHDQVKVTDVKPIPLTAEILEKNFKEFIPGINLMYGLGGPYVASSEKDGQWVFGLVQRDQSARYPLVKITYVHELQHALRLCGIDKEIEL